MPGHERAARLLDEAWRAAEAVADEDWRAHRQHQVVAVLAEIAPDQAVRLAERIARGGHKAQALAAIAQSLMAADPDRAADLLAQAERIVADMRKAPHWRAPIHTDAEAQQVIKDDHWMSVARGAIVAALAPADPDRALSLADRISGTRERDEAVTRALAAMAATDPGRAEKLARGTLGGPSLTTALTAIALAGDDRDRAAQLLFEVEQAAMGRRQPGGPGHGAAGDRARRGGHRPFPGHALARQGRTRRRVHCRRRSPQVVTAVLGRHRPRHRSP
jgi:hypothetical protein